MTDDFFSPPYDDEAEGTEVPDIDDADPDEDLDDDIEIPPAGAFDEPEDFDDGSAPDKP